MKVVYVAHPFTGNEEENRDDAREIVAGLYGSNPDADTVYINPLDNFAAADFAGVGYEKAMKCCLELVARADAVLVCPGWEESKGCRMEVEHAIKLGKPVAPVELTARFVEIKEPEE